MPIFFDKHKGIKFEFSGDSPFITLHYRNNGHYGYKFNPVIKYERVPDYQKISGQSFLWQHKDIKGNFGHLVWEELGSIYYTQKRFSDVDRNVQIIEPFNYQNEKSIKRMLAISLSAISRNPLVKLNDIAKSPICFEKIYVGGQLNLFWQSEEPNINGREDSYFELRNLILEQFKITPKLPTERPVILITNKTDTLDKKFLRNIANIQQVYDFLKIAFPDALVETVEWPKLSITEQFQKISHASILITPCGGISMIIPFLPEKAHAIIMDYPDENGKESYSMEASFWNHFPHIKKMYYQVFKKSDWIMEKGGYPRNDANIIVKTERLKYLVDCALEEMGYVG